MIKSWYLAGAPVDGNAMLFPMDHFPITVGRSSKCSLTIDSHEVSRAHARIEMDQHGQLQVVDLKSTNGTFVNRSRITAPMPLKKGDILHFGCAEFKLKYRTPPETVQTHDDFTVDYTCMLQPNLALPEHFLLLEKEFMEMLAEMKLDVAWQPIVDSQQFTPVAYEVLGRGNHIALPKSPTKLFILAMKLGKEIELSQAFRVIGAKIAARQKGPVCLFMNSHPNEIYTDDFFRSIAGIQAMAPNMELVMEVHETAVNDGDKMKTMSLRLREMGIKIAYDDFGSGQSRLEELADMPADIVKFAANLIRDIDQATSQKQQMVEKLVNIVSSIGSTPLAEGIETNAEATVCQQMGFKLFQGNLTGKPRVMHT